MLGMMECLETMGTMEDDGSFGYDGGERVE